MENEQLYRLVWVDTKTKKNGVIPGQHSYENALRLKRLLEGIQTRRFYEPVPVADRKKIDNV